MLDVMEAVELALEVTVSRCSQEGGIGMSHASSPTAESASLSSPSFQRLSAPVYRYVLFHDETDIGFSLTCGSAAGTNSGCGAGADSTADARSDRAAGAATVAGWSDIVFVWSVDKISHSKPELYTGGSAQVCW